MSLKFPNPSRSFDTSNNRVTFWGYDSVIEVSFSVEGAALVKLLPGTDETKAGYLKTFDIVKKIIYKAAETAYLQGRQRGAFSYILGTEDFK
ncbi:MAG: DUF1488 family protein [Candidatus Thiodiazotropha sp.]